MLTAGLGFASTVSLALLAAPFASAATSTAELTDAVGVVTTNVQDNILAMLIPAVAVIGVVVGISAGLAWLIKTIRRHAK